MPPHGRHARSVAIFALVALAVGIAACGSPALPSPAEVTASLAPSSTTGSSTAPAAATASAPGTPLAPAPQPLDAPGSIAILDLDGGLSLVDAATGISSVLASADEGTFAFPAWSPDGAHLAAIRYGSDDRSILVFDMEAEPTATPTVVFRSAAIGPFYLSWLPDGDTVSYLAGETGGGLSLRLVAADGSGPLDGTGPGQLVGSGNPFYFDWIGEDRMLAHVGTGPNALLGEIGADGAAAGPALGPPGDFRSGVVSANGDDVAYVRATAGGASEVVVATRDGSTERTAPVFGTAAVAFDPTSDRVATIGPVEAGTASITVPIGPLRLIDPAAKEVQTLLDGRVVSYWWSPDGQTIAALRVQPLVPAVAGRTTEVRLLFVDVASGEIAADAVVTVGRLFIDQLLQYFDQYALSHRLWSPDSSSFLLPVVDPSGDTLVAVMRRDGREPVFLEGQAGFWSP